MSCWLTVSLEVLGNVLAEQLHCVYAANVDPSGSVESFSVSRHRTRSLRDGNL